MRTPRRDENGLRKGAWTPEEDQKLIEYIKRYRIWNWAWMAKFAGLPRSGKSCRLRWVNYLNPELKHGNITKEEEDTIISMYSELGSRWSAIAARLPGRTDNQIKNYWHTHLKRRYEEKTLPRIKARGIEVHTFEANNVLNSNEAHQVTTLVSAPESSNSQGSDNLPMTSPDSYMFVGESSSSRTSSSVGVNDIHEIDNASADSSRLNRDLRTFWTQPFSYENMFSVKEEDAYAEEWYQEPTSPYGFYDNNDYWFQFLLEGVRDGLNVTA